MDTAKSNGPGRNTLQTRHLYTLHGEIAWGGMATVRLARQSGPHGWSRIVAVKNLLSRTAPDSELVAMFRDEIRVASRVNHPNVVPVLDVVAAEDQLLLVMEYVHGETVARLLKRCRTVMPPKIACTIMIGVLRGLHAAHLALTERGEPLQIVHRDVTPHNMIVGVDGIPRLLDFGIAHATGRRHETRVGQIKGKLAYMAPEQFLDTAVDRRVDIYSAAVTLWEMLAGRRLFEGHKDRMLKMILHQTVQPPGALQAGIPPQLDAIVMRGLHRDPRQRYETAREMAIALERETETVSATELGDWVRRTWGAAGHRREEQITAIEGRVAAPVDGEAPTTSQNTAVETPRRRLPSSPHLTRPVDHAGDAVPRTVRRDEMPRVNTPTATFGEQRRISRLGLAAPTPAVVVRRSVLAPGAPILLAVAACAALVGHLWRGAGTRPERGLPPVGSAAIPASHRPEVEPLPERGGRALAETTSSSGDVLPAPSLASAPLSQAKEESTSGPLAPAGVNPPSSVAPRPRDGNSPAPPPVRPPASAVPARLVRPRQEGNALKRATAPRHRTPRRAERAVVSSSDAPITLPITPGALVDPMGPPPAPAASRPRPRCDPPFVVDSAGIKRFKPACL
jgi:eukaryotic-like serine/threonine-protein kinase